MVYKIHTAATVEPVSLAEAKAQCRVDYDDHDELFNRLIKQARQYVETVCWRKIMTQTWDIYLDDFPWSDCIPLPWGNLQAVTGLDYTDSNDSTTTWTVSGTNLSNSDGVQAVVDIVSDPGRIVLKYGKSWPSVTMATSNPLHIRFRCGYGDTSASVPEEIRGAMLLLIDHWYRNSSAVVVGQTAAIDSKYLEMGVHALLANYRLHE